MPEIVKRLALAQQNNEMVFLNGEECIVADIRAVRAFFPYTKPVFTIDFYNPSINSKTSIETQDISFLESVLSFEED